MASNIQPLEIGSFRAVSPDESQFLGSSSGIFFVNTVHRAFAISKGGTLSEGIFEAGAQDHPSIDECIVGPESPRNSEQDDVAGVVHPSIQVTSLRSYGIARRGLGIPPGIHQAKELLAVYFQVWHPLFPFLHGPTFMQEIDSFYASRHALQTKNPAGIRRNTCRAVVFQCVFNIAASSRPDLNLSPACYIESSENLLSLLGSELLSKHDVLSLQALLAAQVYLIVTMSLRAASTVGGILLRAMLQSGFHRCPFRYPQLSQHDREIRKRIFWTAYATDRYLSQALGHPLGIQDSDIDVCFPDTEELHSHLAKLTRVSNDLSLHLPRLQSHTAQSSSEHTQASPGIAVSARKELHSKESGHVTDRSSQRQRTEGEEIFANYVMYSRITGQALELFHKSIHIRSVEQNAVLMLTSNVHSWWNSLPQQLQDSHTISKSHEDGESTSHFASFFSVIYQQLILLVNRPFLSQDPQSPQFRSSLQTCIGAGRATISTLKGQMTHKTRLFWPGFLSGIWMSGLILAFACELGLYPFKKTLLEAKACLDLLQLMGKKWTTAMRCHDVLNILVADLRVQQGEDNTLPQGINIKGRPKSSHAQLKNQRGLADEMSSKRQKLSSSESVSRERSEANQQTAPRQQYHVDAYNVTPSEPTLPEVDQGNEVQWLQDPALQGIAPDMQDIFGYLSWESLFQRGNTDTDLWPYNGSDEQDVSRTVLGQEIDSGGEGLAEEQRRQAEEANRRALMAMATRDDPPPPGVLREGPAPPYVEVRFAEEWE